MRYKRLDSADWINHPITPGRYFEPVEGGRPYEWDDVPMYLDIERFLPVALAELSEIELRIGDPDDRLRLTTREIFWNKGQNRILQRVEEGLELFILQFLTVKTPVLSHTVRLNRKADGSLLLEDLSVVETDRGEEAGPSEVLSLPASTLTPDEKEGINLWYRLVGSGTWKAHPLNSRQYYALKDEGTPANWNDPAKHAHDVNYLPLPAEQVAETEVRLADEKGRVRRTVTEVLWNRAQNRIITDADDSHTVVTIQLITQQHPLTKHNIRLSRNSDGTGLLEHNKDVEEMGGKVHETIVHRWL